MSVKLLTDSIVKETEKRITSGLGSAAYTTYVFGEITMFAGNTAIVHLDDRDNEVSGVRVPKYLPLDIGDRVRVALDPTGDAYITEVY